MAALGRKQNLVQQMGQYGQISHPSLTELYSSLGLVSFFILEISSLSSKNLLRLPTSLPATLPA
jgi:hypothetical protein